MIRRIVKQINAELGMWKKTVPVADDGCRFCGTTEGFCAAGLG